MTIRYFNVFGPRQDPSSPYSGVISLFISALCEGRRPKIYGDGEQTRDFTYVANVVDGVLRACHAKDASGEVINVATSGRVSLNQLFRALRDLVGAQVEPIYEGPRAGDVRDSQADISKASRLLGYSPIVTFEQGLKKTVEWYRATAEAASPTTARCPLNGRCSLEQFTQPRTQGAVSTAAFIPVNCCVSVS